MFGLGFLGRTLTIGGIVALACLILAAMMLTTVPAGHVSVGTLFGKVDQDTLSEGLHVTNPLKRWHSFDCRQKTYKFDKVTIPSRDQLMSTADVSLQWRVDRKQAASILQEVGDAEQLFIVHVEPKTRSILRELGKSVARAEDFFKKEEQARLQSELQDQLQSYCAPKGIIIDAVLLRSLQPPNFVMQAIEQKKVREQEAEKQKAELERFKVEQEQLIATAEAQRRAAEEEAQKRRVLADAQAYEIEKINKAIANNPAYVQLQAIEAMRSISQNPANQVYFIDSSAQQPLPLLHMGDKLAGQSK